MKKILMLLCCILVTAPAFATPCDKYGVEVGQWFLENKGSYWQVKECKNDRKGNAELGSAEKLQFCNNPNEDWVGWISKPVMGKYMTMHVLQSAIAKQNINGTGNIALSEYRQNNTACYYCDKGYVHENGKCIQHMTQSCKEQDNKNCKTNMHLTISGGDGCLICGGPKDNCNAGNRIFTPRGHIGKQDDVVNEIWECNPARKQWTHRAPGLCNGSRDLSEDVRAGHATLLLVNPDRNDSHNNASSWIVEYGDICYKYTCNNGWIESGGKCVQDANYKQLCENTGGIYDESSLKCMCADVKGLKVSANGMVCECKDGSDYAWNAQSEKCEITPAAGVCNNSGGTWANGKCTCDQANKHLVLNGGKCVCESANYEFKDAATGCTEKDEVIRRRDEDNRARANRNAQARQACIDSGGDYANNKCTCRAEKHLVPRNNVCECESADYKFENGNVGCVETDDAARRKVCETAIAAGEDAYWENTKCVCRDPDKNFVGGKCQESALAIACKAAKDTIWHPAPESKCECKKEGFEWNGKACYETEESIRNREEAARKAKLDGVNANINNASKKISDILGGLNVSVWKNAEGNFNTARLASDSIAGVVLGTAGGLITSSIVKKSQVKKGFEDIQCTVGGQKVADWGDEFTVGIR